MGRESVKDRFAASKEYSGARIYGKKDIKKPKHLFKVIADKIGSAAARQDKGRMRFLDAGSATGAFGSYLRERFPFLDVTNLEYNAKLHAIGRKNVPGCSFVRGDAGKMTMFGKKQFDFVTMVGVLSIFDDFSAPIGECIRVTADKGAIYIVSGFNEYPVDILRRWRLSGETGAYSKGHNLFSKKSIIDYLRKNNRVLKFGFEKFTLPFDLPRTKDVMRSWTEKDGRGRRIFMNGLGREINLQILEIRLK